MNRIDKTFENLRKKRKKAFIAFLTAGFPDLSTTEKLIHTIEEAGADLIEIGIPFSDPLADGPTIQYSSQKALEHHVNIDQILDLVVRVREKSQIPLALMTYYNPVFHYGEKKFIEKAKAAGVDGLIVPDLPVEEARDFLKVAKENQLSAICFVAPTTTKDRVKRIVQASTGFIYYVSLTGVTGSAQSLPSTITAQIKTIKSMTDKPVCVGFGISTKEQVRHVSRVSDGVIVGSAIVKEIEKSVNEAEILKRVSRLVSDLKNGLYG